MEPKSEIYQDIKTGGLYVVIVPMAELVTNLSSVVVYKSLSDGRILVRPADEFYDDARFAAWSRKRLDIAS